MPKSRWLLATARLAAVLVVSLTVGGGATAGLVLLGRRLGGEPSRSEVAARAIDALPVPGPGPLRRPRRSAEAPARAPDVAAAVPGELPAQPSEAPAAAAPAPAPEPEARVAQPARPARRPAPEIAAEADLLHQALLASRNAHDDHGALVLLDSYQARFPHGALAWEASAMRAQVLLRLGDRGGALAILDRLPFFEIGQPAGLVVTRGELRSLAGRCNEALLDFDLALRTASRLEAPERARAIYGRASCRARTGDTAGAEQDRQRYLREFPEGPAAENLQGRP
jgi:hypothetical protein